MSLKIKLLFKDINISQYKIMDRDNAKKLICSLIMMDFDEEEIDPVKDYIKTESDPNKVLKFVRRNIEIALEHYFQVRELLLGIKDTSDKFSNFPELTQAEYDEMMK